VANIGKATTDVCIVKRFLPVTFAISHLPVRRRDDHTNMERSCKCRPTASFSVRQRYC